jgi:peptidoglycan hydrolase CwlO-like protein
MSRSSHNPYFPTKEPTLIKINKELIDNIMLDRYSDVKGVRNSIEQDIDKLDEEINELKGIILKLALGKKFLQERYEEIQAIKELFDEYDDEGVVSPAQL